MAERKRRRVIWFLVGATILVLVIAIGYQSGGGSTVQSGSRPTREEYAAVAVELDYRRAMLGDCDSGALCVLHGEVFQVFRDTNVLLDTKYDDLWGYLGEKVWLVFADEPSVLEGDVINVYARYSGTRKYDSAMGTEEKVPLFVVDYIDAVDG